MTYASCNVAIFGVLQVEKSFLIEVTIFNVQFCIMFCYIKHNTANVLGVI